MIAVHIAVADHYLPAVACLAPGVDVAVLTLAAASDPAAAALPVVVVPADPAAGNADSKT